MTQNLNRLLNPLDIDEEGNHSISSNHSRILVDLLRTQSLKYNCYRRPGGRIYLLTKALEAVTVEFEDCRQR